MKVLSRMNNPETLTTLGTHETGRKETNKYTLEKAEGVIKIEQSRDTDNIGYTRHRTKTNKQINVREN
jgi:hypothetical protein